MEIFSEILGWLGMIIILLAYFLVSTKRLSPTSKKYQLLNLIGAIGVGFNVFYQGAWPTFVLQIAWGLIAFFAIMRNLKKK